MNERPRIVVLDGHTLNPGDLSWEPLAGLGELEVYPRTPLTEVVARSRDADVILTNKVVLNAATIAACPRLRCIGVTATGYNVVDTAAAAARGIVVTNVPDYGTASVAQHTFALLLELARRCGDHSAGVRGGKWSASEWCYWDSTQIELSGLVLGIVGAGRIGRAVGDLGNAFGMDVRYVRRGDGRAGLESIFRTADVVSLHCPLTDETKHLINGTTLAWLKPTAFLLNTGRGPLVDEQALANALNSGKLAGAAVDVLSVEPPPSSNPLLSARNCIITPHMAWGTLAARARLLAIAIENVRDFLAGEPKNTVS